MKAGGLHWTESKSLICECVRGVIVLTDDLWRLRLVFWITSTCQFKQVKSILGKHPRKKISENDTRFIELQLMYRKLYEMCCYSRGLSLGSNWRFFHISRKTWPKLVRLKLANGEHDYLSSGLKITKKNFPVFSENQSFEVSDSSLRIEIVF